MKLTNDLIRDVLLCIERECESFTNEDNERFCTEDVHWVHIFEDEFLDSKYDIDDIKYCIVKLSEHGLIQCAISRAGGDISHILIDNLTWEGHELLNTIRDDEIWNGIKKKIGDMSKVSLKILCEVSLAYGTEWLLKRLAGC